MVDVTSRCQLLSRPGKCLLLGRTPPLPPTNHRSRGERTGKKDKGGTQRRLMSTSLSFRRLSSSARSGKGGGKSVFSTTVPWSLTNNHLDSSCLNQFCSQPTEPRGVELTGFLLLLSVRAGPVVPESGPPPPPPAEGLPVFFFFERVSKRPLFNVSSP